MIDARLFECIIHQLIFKFHSIIRKYKSGAHMYREIIVDEDMDNSVCLLSGMRKTSNHPVKWSVMVKMCRFLDVEIFSSVTKSMAILSKG